MNISGVGHNIFTNPWKCRKMLCDIYSGDGVGVIDYLIATYEDA